MQILIEGFRIISLPPRSTLDETNASFSLINWEHKNMYFLCSMGVKRG